MPRKVAAVVVSAGLHALAFPPWEASWLAWVALVPLLLVLRDLPPRAGLAVGLLWGSAAIWSVAPWVPPALLFYYQQPWWFGLLFCVTGSIILWGSYYACFGAAYCWMRGRLGRSAFLPIAAALWVAAEFARARLLTGEPWMLLGYTLMPYTTLIQPADLGGVHLLSFLVVLVNLTIAELLVHARRPALRHSDLVRLAAPAVLLAAAFYLYGMLRLRTPLPESHSVPIVVIQGNNDLGRQWRSEFYGAGLESYLGMSAEAVRASEQPAVLVWPESAVTFFLAHEPQYQAGIRRLLQATGTDLLVGAPHYDDTDPAVPRYYNSAFYMTAADGITGRYDKAHLLPFAEYFPLRFIAFLRRHFEQVRSFSAGGGDTLLDTRMGKTAVVICFEAIFPELVREQMARGAEVLVNLSNDAWLGSGAGPRQHASMVALRAVENRTWVVRATTTGISAVFDPFGRTVRQSGTGTVAALDARVEPLSVMTPYKRFGDWFPYACTLISIGTLAFSILGGAGFRFPRWAVARPDDGLPSANDGRPKLRVYFIKPSKYDDDGTVLRFRWGVIPNNTLTVMAGLTLAWGDLHPDLDVEVVLWDEMIDGTVTAEILASISERARSDGTRVLVGLTGVQTNQYPRARDMALQAKALGMPVAFGGFHVSSHAASRDFLTDAGITVFVGESESTWPRALDDFRRGALAPVYRIADGIRARTGLADITVPLIDGAALPAIDDRYARRFFNPSFSTIDTSRGCPFVCSYCSVKNVMGRTMRSRAPADVVAWVRDAYDRHGIRNLLVVDDDLFRSPSWEAILAGMAELRRAGRDLACIIQVDIESAADARLADGERDTAAHRRSARFVDLAAAAGCFEVFMGFESFSPANLEHMLKFHNEARRDRRRRSDPEGARERVKERYRRVVDNWHAAGVGVHGGCIIGLPFDETGCGRRAARDLIDIGVDIASFFAYTPLPGTEDYERAVELGAIVDWDFNAFDSQHFVSAHPRLSRADLAREYDEAYRHFYTWRRLGWSLSTGHRVAGLGWSARLGMLSQQVYFTYATRSGWHPMIGGIWRIRGSEGRREVATDEEAAARYLRPADSRLSA